MTLGLTDLDKLGDGFGVGTYAQDMARGRKEHTPADGDGRVYVVKDVMDSYIAKDCAGEGSMMMALVLKGAKRFYDAQEAWTWARRSIYPALPIVLDDETEALILAQEAREKAERDADADKPVEIWMKSTEVPAPPGLDGAVYLVTFGVERHDEKPLSEADLAVIDVALGNITLSSVTAPG